MAEQTRRRLFPASALPPEQPFDNGRWEAVSVEPGVPDPPETVPEPEAQASIEGRRSRTVPGAKANYSRN
ncbi:hypothetical protein [Micromonospora sp. NPDC093277]|uniref:hypothetical protein n=1 Tax=Micromonospora sp. NPDC093277 TaxID=3364291 RepID=UPI0038055F6D